jgi:hypothetical protein
MLTNAPRTLIKNKKNKFYIENNIFFIFYKYRLHKFQYYFTLEFFLKNNTIGLHFSFFKFVESSSIKKWKC